MQDQLFCRFCGKSMPADSQFCPHCGKSQNAPVVAAVPPTEAPVDQPSSMESAIEKKPSKLPVIFLVIAGVFVLCCVGVLLSQVFMRNYFGATAPEVVVSEMTALSSSGTAIVLEQTLEPMQTASAEQIALTRKWTAPFLMLYIAEQQYQDAVVTFQQIKAGTISRQEFESAYAIPDAYYMIFLTLYRAEELQWDLSDTALDFDPTVEPFVAGLEDDYENVMFIKMDWIAEKIDATDALGRLQQGQAALAIERERMMQAAKMDGMTDEVYEVIQTSLRDQWPELKAKFTEAGIKMMTPQP